MKNFTFLFLLFNSIFVNGQYTFTPFSEDQLYPTLDTITNVEKINQLDSILIYSTSELDLSKIESRYIYRYNDEGNRIEARLETKSPAQPGEPNVWLNPTSYRYEYDANRNLTSSIFKISDEDYEIKSNYSYNNSHQLIKLKLFISNDQISWDSIGSYNYTYNSIGKIESEINFESIYIGKREFHYDSEGNLTLEERYKTPISDGATGALFLESRTEYSYDKMNNLIMIHHYASTDKNIVFLSEVFEISYTAEGNPSHTSKKSYNLDSTIWSQLKEDYEYDFNSNLTRIDQYLLKENIWTNNTQVFYTYDASGNRTSRDVYLWDIDHWFGFSKISAELNESGNIFELETREWLNNWDTGIRYRYYYHSNPSSVVDQELEKPLCYPNPASDKLFFTFDKNLTGYTRIFSQDGNLVINKNFTGKNNQIDIYNLKKGIYLYEISAEGKNYAGKIIKQ